MTLGNDHQRSRRQWLASSLRWTAVAGISLLSADLLARGAGASADGRCAEKFFVCRKCKVWSSCRLPLAETARVADGTPRQGIQEN